MRFRSHRRHSYGFNTGITLGQAVTSLAGFTCAILAVVGVGKLLRGDYSTTYADSLPGYVAVDVGAGVYRTDGNLTHEKDAKAVARIRREICPHISAISHSRHGDVFVYLDADKCDLSL